MFLPLFPRKRQQDHVGARRRGRAGDRVGIEVLENRNPLSAGFTVVAVAAPGFGTVEFRSVAADSSASAIRPQTTDPLPPLAAIPIHLDGIVMARLTPFAGASPESVTAVVSEGSGVSVSAVFGANGPAPINVSYRPEAGELSINGDDVSVPTRDPGQVGWPILQDPFDGMGIPPIAPVARPAADPTSEGDSLVGPLVLDESAAVTSGSTPAVVDGRADTNGGLSVPSGRSTAPNRNVEPEAGAWMSYIAGASADGLVAESTTAAGADVIALDGNADEPSSPPSLLGGEAPLGLLLGGPYQSERASPESQEPVAELVPLTESSLALAGALLSASSASPLDSAAPRGTTLAADGPSQSPGAASSRTVFMIGLNEAVEQTSLDLRTEVVSAAALMDEPGSASAGRARPIEWFGPILPAAGDVNAGTDRPSGRRAVPLRWRAASPRDSMRRAPGPQANSAQSRVGGPARAAEERSVALGAVPIVSAISASTVIAGWIWRARNRWRSTLSLRRLRSRRSLP